MKFEQIYKIPTSHTLKQISFKQKGTMDQDEYWEHEELNSNNEIIAKYKSWSCTSIKPPFTTKSGFQKYDINNNLIEESNNLPL